MNECMYVEARFVMKSAQQYFW